MSTSRSGVSPFSGILILDLADEKASFCSRLLADLGAEVVKIEAPEGDSSRNIGPFIDDRPDPEHSLSFLYHNSGKLGVTLDLKRVDDRERFLKLCEASDVVVETFPPGYLDDIGLGYDVIRDKNNGLILASVTGFGQTGPKSKYNSCDIAAAACGGQMYVCGSAFKEPLKPFGNQSYYLASLFAAIGISLALHQRRYCGSGQHIDISLQEAVAAALEHVLVRYFGEGLVAVRQGSLQWNGTSDLFPCKDGHVLLTFNREWDTLVELLEQQSMSADLKQPLWLDASYRHDHMETIHEILSLWTSIQNAVDVFKLGQSMRFPWGKVNTLEEVFKNEQLQARRFFVQAGHPLVDKAFAAPRPVISFGDSAAYRFEKAPAIGEHNGQILNRALNYPGDAAECRNEVIGTGPKLPLEGVRVLDFTWMLAGPYATRLLGDFGAEVIKVQSKKTANGAEDNTNAYFAMWNRNKLGITLDMGRPESAQLALQLVEKSDIVMENFTPRVMQNWGLDYAKLKEVKPDIIMVSLSGFGRSGPWRNYAALGPTIQALSGLTRFTSYNEGVPQGIGFAYIDHLSGLYAALAALSALWHRYATGNGSYIDISELEAACSVLGPELLHYSINGCLARPQGNRPMGQMAAPYGCYRCQGDDRWCVIAVFNDVQWHKLRSLMGNPGWAGQEKFSSLQSRADHYEELDELIGRWTAGYSPERLMEVLQREGIPATAVFDARDLARDHHLSERGFFIKNNHPVLGQMQSDGTPMRLSRTPAVFDKSAPLLGEDNRYVFLDLLGMDEEQYADYIADGIIA